MAYFPSFPGSVWTLRAFLVAAASKNGAKSNLLWANLGGIQDRIWSRGRRLVACNLQAKQKKGKWKRAAKEIERNEPDRVTEAAETPFVLDDELVDGWLNIYKKEGAKIMCN